MCDLNKLDQACTALDETTLNLERLAAAAGLLAETTDGESVGIKARWLIYQIEHLVENTSGPASAALRHVYDMKRNCRVTAAPAAPDRCEEQPLTARQSEMLETLRRADDLVTETKVAAVLDDVLTSYREAFRLYSQHEGTDHPDYRAAQARENALEAKLLALDGALPGVALAQLAWLLVNGESCDTLFDKPVPFLDFAAAGEIEYGLDLQQAVARLVAAQLAANPSSPVAMVIEKHRQLGDRAAQPDGGIEAAAVAADLLDQALQARHDSLTASNQHEDYQHPDAVAADEREHEASAKLLALDAASPAVAAAQLAYLAACGEIENLFESRRCSVDWLDFAAVEGCADHLPVQQGAAKIVAAYLREHESSAVAAVIARHRALGSSSPAAPAAEAIAAE